MCRNMADWDCLDLDCPDCAGEAERARATDILEVLGALTAIGLARAAHPQSEPTFSGKTPFADMLHSGGAPVSLGLSLRADSAIEACRITCRGCAAVKQLCGR